MYTQTERRSTVTATHGVDRAGVVRVTGTSWGAIWAGFFVALASELILTLLMVGIFAGVLSASPSSGGLAIGVAVWMFIQTLLSYYFGGWVAGRMARATDGGAPMHAIAVWGITTAALLYLIGTLGGTVSAAALAVLRGAFGVGGAPVTSPGGVELAIATWVPIYFFFTLLCSLGCAVWGGRGARA
ncbi:MAG: hypothetical protein ACRENA_16625 [Vulcanimicrobiaceae bacterium]